MATLIDKVYSLNIGVQGENIARAIELDMTEWVAVYPGASFHVLFKPYNESEAVPMVSTFEDNILTWTPTLSATVVSGVGYTEIRALDPETGLIRKSRIIPTSVENSVTGADENPPQPYTDWVNRVLEAGSDAVKGAAAVAAVSQGEEVAFEIDADGHLNIVYTESGEPQTLDLGPVDAYAIAVVEGYTGTREEWVQAMADAEANGLKAEGYAIGKQNGVAVESGEYFHNNAKYYNEQAQSAKEDAEAAQTAAETAQTAAETAQNSAAASAADALEHTQSVIETWLGNNIDPDSGYALDRTLAISTAAAPADMVGDLKSALCLQPVLLTEKTKNVFNPYKAKLSMPDLPYTDGEFVGIANKYDGMVLLPSGAFSVGDQVTISFDLRTEGSDPKHGLCIVVKAIGGTNEHVDYPTAYSHDDFIRRTFTYTITENTDYIIFAKGQTSSYIYHIKNIQVEKSGSATEYIPPYMASDKTARKTANIAKNAVDTTLNGISANEINLLSTYGTHTNATTAGVSFTWNQDNTICTANGTSTGISYNNIMVYSAFIPDIILTQPMILVASSAPENLYAQLFFYISGSLDDSTRIDLMHGITQIDVPTNATGILFRILAVGTVNNDTIKVQFVNHDGSYLPAIGNITIDASSIIVEMLERYGECHLGKGLFGIKGIEMPANTKLYGAGADTQLIMAGSNQKNYAIKMSDYCTVRDIFIRGANSDITLNQTVGSRHGILWQGDFASNSDEDDQPHRGIISNCFIDRFIGGAITCENTGTGITNCLNVSDCHIRNCKAGINVEYLSEFNRFTNININGCYYGIVNNGGNNVFVNCNASGNVVGFVCDMVDGSGRNKVNNLHGSAIGCVFNHIDYDSTTLGKGDAIRIKDADNGFVFDGCQIFYGKVYIENAKNIMFSSCEFGALKNDQGQFVGFPITLKNTDSATRKTFIIGCMFISSLDPVFTVENTGSGTIAPVIDASYGSSGNEIVWQQST